MGGRILDGSQGKHEFQLGKAVPVRFLCYVKDICQSSACFSGFLRISVE